MPSTNKTDPKAITLGGSPADVLVRTAWMSDASADENARFIAGLTTALETNGYAHLKGEFSRDDYRKIAERLGTVFLVNDVRVIDTDRTQDVGSNSGFGFHTDSFCANFVSWYCVTPGSEREPTLLLDLADLAEHLSNATCQQLTQIRMAARPPDVVRPIVSVTPDRIRLNFIPWRLMKTESATQASALREFRELIANRAMTPGAVIPVKLEKGEILIIDNHRVLHGRPPLNKETPRHLLRFWISSDPAEEERWARSHQLQMQVASFRRAQA